MAIRVGKTALRIPTDEVRRILDSYVDPALPMRCPTRQERFELPTFGSVVAQDAVLLAL